MFIVSVGIVMQVCPVCSTHAQLKATIEEIDKINAVVALLRDVPQGDPSGFEASPTPCTTLAIMAAPTPSAGAYIGGGAIVPAGRQHVRPTSSAQFARLSSDESFDGSVPSPSHREDDANETIESETSFTSMVESLLGPMQDRLKVDWSL